MKIKPTKYLTHSSSKALFTSFTILTNGDLLLTYIKYIIFLNKSYKTNILYLILMKDLALLCKTRNVFMENCYYYERSSKLFKNKNINQYYFDNRT